jgi:hypothetical protein
MRMRNPDITVSVTSMRPWKGRTLPKKRIGKFLLHRYPRKIGSAGCTEARLTLDVLGTFWTIAEVNNLFKLLK